MKSATPAATDTFNEDTSPAIGIRISTSQCLRTLVAIPCLRRRAHERWTDVIDFVIKLVTALVETVDQKRGLLVVPGSD